MILNQKSVITVSWRVAIILLAVGLLPRIAEAQGLDYVRAHYTKYEYQIPMRDGMRLFMSVYVPKDHTERMPILLDRTPYSVRPYGLDQYKSDLGPSPLFAKSGYIFAYQDVRGRWMSEGELENMRPHLPVKKSLKDIDESTDTFDTIEWLMKNVPNNNGRVGIWGISYPGFYTAAGMIDAHPALVAASPQAPIVDWFVGDDWHHNGALFLPHVFNFMASFGRPRPKPTTDFNYKFDHGTPDGYDFFLRMGPLPNADAKYFKGDVAFWNEVMQHHTYDEFWKARNLRPHLKNIRPAVMTVGGWFDAENLFGALETYKSVEAASPGISNTLVMGPWWHGGWNSNDGQSLGDVNFGSKTSAFYRETIEFPFFEHYLKGTGELKQPEAWVFETGTNKWHQHATWPPKEPQTKSLFVHAGGRLSFDLPTETNDVDAHDEYTSDPAKPVPYFEKITIGMDPTYHYSAPCSRVRQNAGRSMPAFWRTRLQGALSDYMVADQRFAARRPDVLAYRSDLLQEPITVAGPIQADIFVSTSGTDSDWVVKVIDVFPDNQPDPDPNPGGVRLGGFQQLVRGDVMRGKFRNSFEKPEPFVPNEPTRVRFTLPDVYHTFQPGHRIMVQIQSTWFPLVDRNPQTFVDINAAKETDFRSATQRLYHSQKFPSRVTVGVLP